jgi:hypothetical protein
MSEGEQAVSPVDAPVLMDESVQWVNRKEQRSLGNPGGGAIVTAANVALFYQAVIADRAGDGPGLWHSGAVAVACMPRNVEQIDPITGQAALRGLGVVVAGKGDGSAAGSRRTTGRSPWVTWAPAASAPGATPTPASRSSSSPTGPAECRPAGHQRAPPLPDRRRRAALAG